MRNQLDIDEPVMKKKLLLHVCCAPCAVYVVKKLEADYDVTLFFYNPNIQPKQEYQFRKKELERIARLKNWHVVYPGYEMEEWFNLIKKLPGYAQEPERGRRCSLCFNIRLKKAFEYAEEHGYDTIASTLSISPYKVTGQINEEGTGLSRAYGIEFLPENFKKKNGYNIGRKLAVELGVKHQNYCGCVFSKVEKKLKEREKIL